MKKLVLKFTWNCKGQRTAKAIFKKIGLAERLKW
jgi:hypothetical protein